MSHIRDEYALGVLEYAGSERLQAKRCICGYRVPNLVVRESRSGAGREDKTAQYEHRVLFLIFHEPIMTSLSIGGVLTDGGRKR